ncbi:MAG: DUF4290 domain-containing protein [Bacteroidetes bacterium]|nr:DUF4290 domain-containing protein [Bacteroidota bacterium]
MEYNTSRSKMNISEYGRNIQKMIEHIKTVESPEKRNILAKAIIQVMGQLNPHLRDVSDFKHKLWDHLFIMSNFSLDVESPYPIPSAETLTKKPEILSYPSNNIKYKHYGRHIERMIEKAIAFPEGDEKNALVKLIANHLKKSYLTWSRDSVNDEDIAADLATLSGGKLTLDDKVRLHNTSDILYKSKKKKHPLPKAHGNQKQGNYPKPHFKSRKPNP